MQQPTFSLVADFDRDEVYEFEMAGDVSLRRGRVKLRLGLKSDGTYQVSQITLRLDNTHGVYTRDNPASPIYGLTPEHAPVRLTATHDGITYTLWTGYIQRLRVHTDGTPEGAYADLVAQDVGVYLDAAEVNVTASTARSTSDAIAAILTAAGLTADDYDLDPGVQQLPFHYVQGQQVIPAIMDVVQTEMGGAAFVNAVGRVRFLNRRARLGISRYREDVLRLRPVGYWRMGAPTGNIPDETGHGLTAAVVGAPTYDRPGLLAEDPDASVGLTPGSHFAVADHALLDIQDALTVVAWVRFDQVQDEDVSIVDKGGAGPYLLRHGKTVEDSRLQGFVAIGGNYHRVQGPTVEADRVYMVALVYDGESLALYVDGALTESIPLTGQIDTNNSPLYLGAGQFGLDGDLDDVAVWDRALTPAEIATLWRAGTGETWVWGDQAAVAPEGGDHNPDPLDYIDEVTLRTTVYHTGQAGQVLWVSGEHYRNRPVPNSRALAPGEVLIDRHRIPAGVVAFAEPEAGVDWLANDAANGSSTDRTNAVVYQIVDLGGGAFERRVRNTHNGTVYLTWSQVRGQQGAFTSYRPEFYASLPVPGQLRGRPLSADLPFIGGSTSLPRDFAYQLLRTGRVVWPRLTRDIPWNSDSNIVAMLTAQIGDLVRYRDQAPDGNRAWVSGVDDWFRIEAIEHELAPGGMTISRVTLLWSAVYRDLDRIVFDTFDRGDLTGNLGTSTSGDTWANASGFNLTSNRAIPNTTNATVALLGDLGVGDMIVEADAGAFASDNAFEAGVAVRAADASNRLDVVIVRDDDAWAVELRSVTGGVPVTIASAELDELPGAWLRVMAQGYRVRVWVNERLTIDEQAVADHRRGTRCGIVAAGTTSVWFANVYGQGV